jgi:cellulose synthase/poly-beta-1,6-N-acetylglucosamine synthase-like glycosyltransferase
MTISLIIAFYKKTDALDLIFKALTRQSFPGFEVIIAEDDNNPAARVFLDDARRRYPFPIKHVWQDEDRGFRKNVMLNRSIAVATGEYLVFIDGDCIPHPHFLRQYARLAREGEALFGRRVMLSEGLTNELLRNRDLRILSLPNLIRRRGGNRLRYGLYLPFLTTYRREGIWGCNWGVHKKHLMKVNGFDEDYVRAAIGEDTDIEWRLVRTGVRLKSIRFGAIIYHLHHPVHVTDEGVQFNIRLMRQKMAANHIYCLNGLDQHLATSSVETR